MNRLLATIALSTTLLLTPSCTTVKGVKSAAYLGTSLALTQHPEWRLGFEQAYASLGVLEAADTISVAEVLAILHTLPVKELRSPTAVIIITSIGIVIEEVGGPEIDQETVEKKIRPIVKDLRAGIKLGLESNFAFYSEDGKVIVMLAYQ